jgi:hypothetical protein
MRRIFYATFLDDAKSEARRFLSLCCDEFPTAIEWERGHLEPKLISDQIDGLERLGLRGRLRLRNVEAGIAGIEYILTSDADHPYLGIG